MKTRRQDKQPLEDERQELKETIIDEDEGVSETDEEIEEEEFEEAGMESSGDDSAPEDISFAKSKEQAIESLSRALKAVQEQRKQIKEKRQKHNNLLSEQKKKKLQKLQEKKLSAEFLQQVSETSFQKPTTGENKDEPTNKSEDVNHRRFVNDDEDEAGEVGGGDEPVPIADRFYVVAAEKAEKNPHPTPPSVHNFLQHSLYGKHLNRKPVTDVLATKAKVEQRPADNFRVSKGRKKRRGYKRRPLPIA